MKDENLLEAFNAWESLSQTQETIIAYQSRLKVLIDEEARLADVREEGIEEGMEKRNRKGNTVTWHINPSKNPPLFSNSNRLIIERSWKNVLKFGHIVKGAFFYDDFS